MVYFDLDIQMSKDIKIEIGSKVTANLIELVDFAAWWICIGKSRLLQPAQQACLRMFISKHILLSLTKFCV